jgi:hypothetical protein
LYIATVAPTPTTAEASSAVGRETRPPRTRSPAASATFPTAASVAMECAYRHVSDVKLAGGDALARGGDPLRLVAVSLGGARHSLSSRTSVGCCELRQETGGGVLAEPERALALYGERSRAPSNPAVTNVADGVGREGDQAGRDNAEQRGPIGAVDELG